MVLTAGLYWLVPARLRHYFLIVSTAGVLIAVDSRSLLTLILMTATVCFASHARAAWQSRALLGACAAIVVTLFVFKILDASISTTTGPFL